MLDCGMHMGYNDQVVTPSGQGTLLFIEVMVVKKRL